MGDACDSNKDGTKTAAQRICAKHGNESWCFDAAHKDAGELCDLVSVSKVILRFASVVVKRTVLLIVEARMADVVPGWVLLLLLHVLLRFAVQEGNSG